MESFFTNVLPMVGVILQAILALHAFALVIVNLTPTPMDDDIVGKFYKVIEFLAGIVTRYAKQLPMEPDDFN